MSDYLKKTFTEEEVTEINRLLDVYENLFPHFVSQTRVDRLKELADNNESDFSKKVCSKMKSSRKYKEMLEKVYVAYGYSTIK